MIPLTRRERYLKQSIPIRLGGLSANLARIVSTATVPAIAAVSSLIDESRAFIEWCAPDLLPDRVDDAASLVDIQRGLTHWYWNWDKVQHDLIKRQELAAQAQVWSDQVLAMSGLLEQE
jgi:hypothetical protein